MGDNDVVKLSIQTIQKDVEKINKDVDGFKTDFFVHSTEMTKSNAKVENQITNLTAKISDVLDRVVKHDKTLYNKDGNQIRLDRLEQSEGRRNSHFKAIWAILGTIVAGICVSWVTHKEPEAHGSQPKTEEIAK